MGIRTWSAVGICKLTRGILRKLGKGGTNLPGKAALRIRPDLLGILAKNVTTIIVTGTNGKTTTSRMIEKCLQEAGLSYFANKSGANMLPGITAEFAAHSGLNGKNRKQYALIECDEAAFRTVSRYVGASCVVVTNIFRDQLDRYGEVTHTLSSILEGIKHSPEAVVCLNADCSLSVSMVEQINNSVLLFGVDCEIYQNKVQEVSDAPYCIRCKTEYEYDYRTFGHLGGFLCPKCGYRRPDPDIAVTRVKQSNEKGSELVIRIGKGGAQKTGELSGDHTVLMPSAPAEYDASVNLPGGYNIYNAAAAVAAGHVLKMPDRLLIDSLSRFECGFGRMESISIGQAQLRMILIKNPAGCNQVLNFLSNLDEPSLFVIALNDRDADGTDVSWIWDVDFEKLTELSDLLTGVWTTGVRADEMAVRIQYAGISSDKIRSIGTYDTLLTELEQSEQPVYLMPTYTAMLEIREELCKRYGIKKFWE